MHIYDDGTWVGCKGLCSRPHQILDLATYKFAGEGLMVEPHCIPMLTVPLPCTIRPEITSNGRWNKTS